MRFGLACLLVVAFASLVKCEETETAAEEVLSTIPELTGSAHFSETFAGGLARWVHSQAKKDGADEAIAKYDGQWKVEPLLTGQFPSDDGLVLKSVAKHHAISAKLTEPFTFRDEPLIVQYEVNFQNGMECGGAYVKLLMDSANLDLDHFGDKTGYTIMFGPDKCGTDSKLHFIFRHKNPVTGEFEEKHAKKPSGSLDFFSDKKTHVFRLTVSPDNSWEVHVDGAMVNAGSLLEDMTPPVSPPAEIDDPEDMKPEDWDDRKEISDPDASKPEDWDESLPEHIEDEAATMPADWLEDEAELIPDADASKPEDWDEDMDGEWEAPKVDNPLCAEASGCGQWKRPTIKNPDYKGKWVSPKIKNPAYKGVWAPRRIPNPGFFEDKEPFRMQPIAALGLELWSMTGDVLFDNFLITSDQSVADEWTQSSWTVKSQSEHQSVTDKAKSVWGAFMDLTEEKPWVWAIVAVAAAVPLVLIYVCCCMGGDSDSKASGDSAAQRKKTDAPTPDDPVTSDGHKEEAAGGDAPSKSARSALNDKEEEEEVDDEDEGGTADEGAEDTAEEEVDDSEETPAAPVEVEEEEEESQPSRTSPRKRKARKD